MAPAYSLAAALAFVVGYVGLQSPVFLTGETLAADTPILVPETD